MKSEPTPTLYLHETRARKKLPFVPIDSKNVRIYGCGPTVYDRIHVGNARSFVIYDLLFRVLRHIYGQQHVVLARNITDVDDKINAAAAQKNITIGELTATTTAAFLDDLAALNTLTPTHQPRATEHINDMIAMIEQLVAKRHAYVTQGHVMFAVGTFADYGSLSGRSLEQMRAGARIEVSDLKGSPLDFVMWKPASEQEPGWHSPWGYGRPGWHIECSAMAKQYLGSEFDLHIGGNDLIFPHHENEIAQSRCCFDTDTMSRYWVHVGFVQFSDVKMSKSLGNTVTVEDALNQAPPEALRLALLGASYRHPMLWNQRTLADAAATLKRWYNAARHAARPPESARASHEVEAALYDDLGTPRAIAALHAYAGRAENGDAAAAQLLVDSAALLGLLENQTAWENWHAKRAEAQQTAVSAKIEPQHITELVRQRDTARANRDFARADALREQLSQLGIDLQDHAEGSTWRYRH